ncbi:MAG: WG repeat-containing protein [Flavobacteriales bacterium]|nr:MAG: WG repeat-containing protein [Flavobacteriales bacterium]
MKANAYTYALFMSCSALTLTAQTAPGTVAANAVTIAMEQGGSLFPFKDGVAVVERGDAVGLINPKGEFIVPYKKYREIIPIGDGYSVVQNDAGKHGLIDAKGVELVPCEFNRPDGETGIGPYLGSGHVLLSRKTNSPCEIKDLITGRFAVGPARKQIVFAVGDGAGPVYNVNYPSELTANGLVPARERIDSDVPYTSPIGFIDFSGVWVIKPKYLRVHPFSEGLAAVMIADEFGEKKWGYIDRTGNWIVTPRFTKEPGDFHHGLAYVEPKDMSDFRLGFINRNGDVVVKCFATASDGFANGVLVAELQNGQPHMLVDTTGTARPFPKNGTAYGQDYALFIDRSGCPVGWTIDRQGGFVVRHQRWGLVDLQGTLIIPPVFNTDLSFDPVSGLCLTSFTGGDGKKVEGYIDRTGSFVLVKGAESKW